MRWLVTFHYDDGSTRKDRFSLQSLAQDWLRICGYHAGRVPGRWYGKDGFATIEFKPV